MESKKDMIKKIFDLSEIHTIVCALASNSCRIEETLAEIVIKPDLNLNCIKNYRVELEESNKLFQLFDSIIEDSEKENCKMAGP